jgi:hypothetical protein
MLKGEKNIMRKLISYIFTCVLLIGCNSNVIGYLTPPECESDFDFEISSSDLVIDENGYYHIEWLNNYSQTFVTLEVVTNTEGYHRIHWSCCNDLEYVSHTNGGITQQTITIEEHMIGDTVTVYAASEVCYGGHVESIKIVVDDEI